MADEKSGEDKKVDNGGTVRFTPDEMKELQEKLKQIQDEKNKS